MKKMTLDLASLRVESFAAETPEAARGTVHAEGATRVSACASACATCANCSSYPYVCFCTEYPDCAA
jgi:hypothetical protein